mmetsp:Transcript_3889/g.16691  ORF Transcript_3889/g.16691 Transcript_3889/m.16691 type:complete len:86 (+) Transcript_3889:732-989(+)
MKDRLMLLSLAVQFEQLRRGSEQLIPVENHSLLGMASAMDGLFCIEKQWTPQTYVFERAYLVEEGVDSLVVVMDAIAAWNSNRNT